VSGKLPPSIVGLRYPDCVDTSSEHLPLPLNIRKRLSASLTLRGEPIVLDKKVTDAYLKLLDGRMSILEILVQSVSFRDELHKRKGISWMLG
jgi:hypothetical protein